MGTAVSRNRLPARSPGHRRRSFSAGVPALVLAIVACSPSPVVRAEDERPDIVVLLSDDHAFDFQSGTGHPWVRTPAMDGLATDGVRFENAFVTTSLCSPSRASFLTGTYSHTHGVRTNHQPFPRELPTYASLLAEAGYDTAYVGKWHMGEETGSRPGFAYSASYAGHGGGYTDVPFEVDGETTPTRGFVDDVAADLAIGFLERPRERPRLLVVGFKAPHRPLFPPDRTKELYVDAPIDPRPNATALPPYGRLQARKRARVKPYSDEQMRDYGRLVTALDENIGRVVRAVDRSGRAERTVIVYASDNGMMLGAHGQNNKTPAYEESIRIPFLLRYPALVAGGQTVDAMVLNVDLAPTLLDLAGVPVPGRMQGASLLPLLGDEPTGWRDVFFYEFRPQENGICPATIAVRTADRKLVTYPGHPEWTELFDLEADPLEERNLADDPEHAAVRASLAARLDGLKDELGFE